MNQAPSETRTCWLHDAVLRPEGLTIQPHTDLYLSGDFILMCGDMVKLKKTNFCHFPGKLYLVGKKFLHHKLPNLLVIQRCHVICVSEKPILCIGLGGKIIQIFCGIYFWLNSWSNAYKLTSFICIMYIQCDPPGYY